MHGLAVDADLAAGGLDHESLPHRDGHGLEAGRVGPGEQDDLALVDAGREVTACVCELLGLHVEGDLARLAGLEVDERPVGELDERAGHLGDGVAEVELDDLAARAARRCWSPSP